MSLIHPLQSVVCSRDGQTVVVTLKNTIVVLKHVENSGKKSFKLIGKWTDNLDRDVLIKEYVLKEQKRQLLENQAKSKKKAKNNEGADVPKNDAKIPVPGPGAPPIYSQIRCAMFSHDESMVIACADSDKSVLVFNIDQNNTESCLFLKKRQPYPKRPNSITITEDDKTVMIADKFGDVYAMEIEMPVVPKIDDEVEPILGHVSMLTSVTMAKNSDNKKFIITTDRDEHIKISHYPQTFIVDKWLFGHKAFISSVCIPDWKTNWIISAGGDPTVELRNWESGKFLSSINYHDIIKPYINDQHLAIARFQNESNDLKEFAVSKIVALPETAFVAFFVEATPLLIIAKVDPNSGVMEVHQTLELPYNITSISVYHNAETSGFYVTLDNRTDSMQNFIKIIAKASGSDNFVVSKETSTEFDSVIVESLQNEDSVKTELDHIFPLYNIISLKKHGEHFS